jgi:acyl phosphate:glycerol-3-phosphate acyltransferase
VTLAMVLATAYLLGSIPTSYIVVYLVTGRDIRTLGDGNPGTMNVLDSVGVKPAVAVAAGDIGKGMAAVGFAYWIGLGDSAAILAALMAIAGHDYSIFLRFDGGNGTAAAVGGLLALVPSAALPAAGVAVVVFLIVRSKRIAGLASMGALPVIAYYQDHEPLLLLSILIIFSVVSIKIVRFEGFTPARSDTNTRPRR